MNPVEVKNLKKNYGALQAVDELSFTVKTGQVFGLLGPNGAGKTTTIEIVEGLRKKDGGTVEVFGLDPWVDGEEVHRKIGVIPQNFSFFEKITPREAIKYYARVFSAKVDVEELLNQVLLEKSADQYFDNLSGGQKQKLGLALSLVNSPELLFLDEPTTGLDPNARRAVWEVIRGLKKQNKTVILTTHYLEEAEQLSDRVAIVNHGRIVASGTSKEIIEQYGSKEKLEIRGNQQLAHYIQDNTDLKVNYTSKGIISIVLEKRVDALAALAAAEQSNLPWGEIQTRQDSLEDVFIKLVNGEVDEQGQVVIAKGDF
jgi:ABC-2 type transport system ATP-binding protein